MDTRISWDQYFIAQAAILSTRSTCTRLHVGAIIVRDHRIIASGYNGSVAGTPHCTEVGDLIVDGHCVRAVHAEQNAIISAARKDLIDSTLYLVGKEAIDNSYVKNANPCILCKRFILNAGIKEVIIRKDKNNYEVIDTKTYIDNDESLDEKFGY